MPRSGSKTITVTDEKHLEAMEIANKLGITLKEYVESLIGEIPQRLEQDFNSQSLEVPA